MSLSKTRIVSSAMTALEAAGFAPSEVLYMETGKSATEIMLEALVDAIISEIQDHGEVSVTLDPALATWMGLGIPVPLDGGTSLKTSLIAAATNLQASGAMS